MRVGHWRGLLRTRFEPPEFCRGRVLFTTLVAAQLVVVTLWLAGAPQQRWSLPLFFSVSTLALWLGLLGAVALCKARPWLQRWPTLVGALASWALPVLTVWLGSWAVHSIGLVLQFGMEHLSGTAAAFADRNAAIAAVLYAALLRYFYVQEQWLRNERAQARAAVDALQARIKPHFLFNSLNSIASLVRRNPVTAERALEDLADLFRAALGAGEGMSTLGEELALCRRYLDIEKLRLADRLQVRIEVADEVPLDTPAPRLALQPLVENAVHHGISKLPGGGCIELQVRLEGGQVVMLLSNPLPRSRHSVRAGNQHAVANIEQRLAYHFGDQARLESDQTDNEFRVTLSLPRGTDGAASAQSTTVMRRAE